MCIQATLTALTNSDRSTDTKRKLFFSGAPQNIWFGGILKTVPTGVNKLSNYKEKKTNRGGMIFVVIAKYQNLCVKWLPCPKDYDSYSHHYIAVLKG